jgi:hypothetical protein
LIIILFPYLWISQYSNPVTDDLTYAFKGKNPDFWNIYFSEYKNWNGRYFSNFLVLTNPIANDDFTFYKFIPILLIFLTFASLIYLIHQLTSNILKASEKIIISLILLLIYLQAMPIISEGIYWYTGAVTYQVGIISMVFFLGMMVQLHNGICILKNKWVHSFLMIFLLFMTAGCNELSMVLAILFLLLLIMKSNLKSQNRKMILFFLITSFFFGCLVYFAPGNENRGNYFAEKHQIFHSLLYSSAQTIRFSVLWLSGGTLLIASVLYYPICKKLSAEIPLFKKSFYVSPLTALILSLMTIFIGAFLPYWSTGILGQHRTMNVSFFFFLLSWFVFLTSLYNSKYLKWQNLHSKIKILLFSMLCMTLFFTQNGWNVWNDLYSGKAQSYNDQMNVRYEKIRKMNGDLYLPLIKNPPKTLFVLDLTEDPNHWQNRSYTVFFEKTEYLIYPEE